MIKKNLILAIVIVAIGLGVTLGFASDAVSQLLFKNVVIDEKNHPKPVDITMAVKEVAVGAETVVIPETPVTLKSGDSAVYKIRVDSKESKALPLKLRVFNADDEHASNLALARVQFNEDISGLPQGLTATLENDIATISSKDSHEETLTITIGQDVKPGNYTIGVLALTIVGNIDDIEIGNGQILTIPIIIQ